MALGGSCPGSKLFKDIKPEYLDCAVCGHEVEIWSDELVARCPQCKSVISRDRGASCIDWCRWAQECVGAQKYRQLQGGRQPEKANETRNNGE